MSGDDRNGGSPPADFSKPYGEHEPGTGGRAHPVPVADQGEGGPPVRPWAPPGRSIVYSILLVVLALIAVLVLLAAWRLPPFLYGGPRTDDAYVEGDTTVVAPQVSGYIKAVTVRDYAHVRAGQLLVLIDDSSYRAAVLQAQAQVAQALSDLSNNTQSAASARATLQGKQAALGSARAQLVNASRELARDEDLVRDGSVSRRERDQAEADYRAALASVRQAQADIAIARESVSSVGVNRKVLDAQVQGARASLYAAGINLRHTRIDAPVTGQLSQVSAHVGAFVSNGTQLFSLVPSARWVIANYKEGQTHGMRVGQHATFTVDALAGRRFDGFVKRIAPATGAEFSVVKPDNATGNFVKTPQRIGILIAIPAGQPFSERLRPGMSVETLVDTAPGDGAVDHPHPARPR